MNKLIEDFLINIHKEFKYSVFFYDTKSKEFGEIQQNKIFIKDIPELIKPILEDNNVVIKKYIKEGKEIIFYFLRQFLEDRKIVIIIQDLPDHTYLNHFFSIVLKNAAHFFHEHLQNERELDFMREELSECESEVSGFDDKIIRLEDELYDKSKELDRLSELVSILKNSRSKLLKMVDSMHLPLFSMDLNFDIVNVNKALGNYLNIDDLPSFIGRGCFKVVYNNDAKCEWCKVYEVLQTKEKITQNIEVEFNSRKYTFSQTMFPILDSEGEVVEIGEYLIDITKEYNLINSLEKTREKIKKISRDKIDKINEISSLKKEYDNLYEDYEESKKNILKLKSALEILLRQNSVNELLKLKTELKDLQVKYERSLQTIHQYEEKFKQQESYFNELNKKSIYSVDRLINILNNKKEVLPDDANKVLEFLNSQIKILRDNIIQEDSNGSESSD